MLVPLVHWTMGMAFLMSVGSLLSLTRRLLRQGEGAPAVC
jgi:hypothetical protein